MNSIGQGYTSQKGNDYIKFSNGLIVQWGTTTQTPETVTFGISFTQTPSVVLADVEFRQDSAFVANRSITGVTINRTACWLAIGY